MKYEYSGSMDVTPGEVAEFMQVVADGVPSMIRTLLRHVKEIKAEITAKGEPEPPPDDDGGGEALDNEEGEAPPDEDSAAVPVPWDMLANPHKYSA